MKHNLYSRFVITVLGIIFLIDKSAAINTEARSEDIQQRIEVSQILENHRYTKSKFDEVIADMKESINTIWIVTASVSIISM